MENKTIIKLDLGFEFPDSQKYPMIQEFIAQVKEAAENIGGELVSNNFTARQGSFLPPAFIPGVNDEYRFLKICVRPDVVIGGHQPPIFLLEKDEGGHTTKRIFIKPMDASSLRDMAVATEYSIGVKQRKLPTVGEAISFLSKKCLLACCNQNGFTVQRHDGEEDEITIAIKYADWEKLYQRINRTPDLGTILREQLVLGEIRRIDGLD